MKIKIKKGDKVRVIAGKYKGKESPVLKVLPKKGEVILEGVSHTKHIKPSQNDQEGGIQQVEKGIRISNVCLIDPKKKKELSKIGFSVINGKKVRIARKSNSKLA